MRVYLDAKKMTHIGEADDEAVESTDNCKREARVRIHFGFNVPLQIKQCSSSCSGLSSVCSLHSIHHEQFRTAQSTLK